VVGGSARDVGGRGTCGDGGGGDGGGGSTDEATRDALALPSRRMRVPVYVCISI